MWFHSLLLLIALSCSCSADGERHDFQAVAMTMGTAQSPGPGGPSSTSKLLELVQNQQQEDAWRTKVLNLLTQLVLIQKEAAKHQVQVLQQLGIMGTQGAQQIQDLQNLARHQSLLVENHQALLLQTSRIASHLQEITKKPAAAAKPPGHPLIYFNSTFLPNGSSKVLTTGSTFTFSCHGNGSVYWSSTAFPLRYQNNLPNPLEVRQSGPRHTGTYRCGYTNRSLDQRDTWIHLYVKDPDNPASVFVTPRSKTPALTEGQDFQFWCLLTDPSVTNLTFQETKGRGLPPGMNVTFDPREGVRIRDLKASFSGSYVCSGWKDGKQFTSSPADLLVLPKPPPPSVILSQNEAVRLEGEPFEVTCLSTNPSHSLSVTWTHPKIQELNITKTQQYRKNHLHISSTVTVSAVSQTHSGPYTCTAVNEAGAVSATTQLKVLDQPYLRIYVQVIQNANANTWTVHGNANISSMLTEFLKDLKANISSTSLDVNEELIANVSYTDVSNTDVNGASNANISGSRRVEVHEGRDVILTFVMEAYPRISSQYWTSTHNGIMKYHESYTANGYRTEGSLLLRQVRQKDRGPYYFHFSNSFFNGSQNVDLRIFRPPTAVITVEDNTLTCSSSGYPLPTVLWFTCPGIQHTCANSSMYHVHPANVASQKEEEVRIHHRVSVGDDVSIECVAYNLVGDARDIFRSRSAGSHTIFTPALSGALSAATVLLLLLLVVFYKYRQKPKYEIRWKIIESTDGNNYIFVDPTQLPYNQKWEFPRDQLRLGAVLGSGAFGKVVEATAYGLGTDNKVTRVAVKMLKPSAHSEEREALMSELKILSHLGYHDNIVNLLGACTRGGPMLMITEYCSHGDLLNFLRAHAHDFMASIFSKDQVEEEEAFYKNMAALHVRLRSDSGISCCSDYQEMLPVLSPAPTEEGVKTGCLSVSDLIRFSYQVAQGLDFLSTRNCIHRDVAARNVLLTDHHVAKICDFGLARDIRNDDSYIVQGNARLPVKWMAPESIFQCVYTVQSDVWSYGVLLWEIFSLGKSPYPNTAVDTNFYKMIKDGRHMERPDFASAEMYQLMTLCWSLEPTDRPTFNMIRQLINRLLPSTNDTSTHHSTQPTYRNINECREEDEDEEKEEIRGVGPKRGEQEQDRLSDEGEEEEESRMKNIYQLS